MLTDLLAQLNGSITILTPNQRLSAYLNHHYDHHQHLQGLSAWPSLDCLPLSAWVRRLYANGDDPRQILTEWQILTLWRSVIETFCNHAHDTYPLINAWRTAQLASTAWRLAQQWRLPLSTLTHHTTSDVRTFATWASHVQQRYQQQHIADDSHCFTTLIDQAPNYRAFLPQHLVLAAFDEIPPLTQQLLDALAPYCHIHTFQPCITPHTLQRAAFPSPEHEVRAMAHWSKRQLAANPQARIGCIMLDLANQRDMVERVCTEVLATDITLGITDEAHLPFNISAGQPLLHFPLIAAAYTALQLNRHSVSLDTISALLRTPFLGGSEQELWTRARWDSQLRRRGECRYNLTTLLATSAPCPQLATNLHALRATLSTRRAPLNHWATQFATQLQLLGWPGERSLSSHEFQQLERWQQLLHEFASLEQIDPAPVSASTALERLQQLAQHLIFQPQSGEKPLQILGSLEAVGHTFDYVWLLGANQHIWPPAPQPNPFLPNDWQRQHHMPHASPERTHAFSQLITDRICRSAPHIVASYSTLDGDLALHPSVLIEAIPLIDSADLAPELTATPTLPTPIMEHYHDDQGPPVATQHYLRGGAALLKNQAACPFRAFAYHRLGARTPPPPSPVLSASERGDLVHTVLEQLWAQLGDHANLMQHTPTELRALIHTQAQQVLQQKAQQRPLSFTHGWQAVEQQRLTDLLSEWLAWEKTRPPFRVVTREATQHITLGGLTIRVRLDREDELADGLRLIIDYKTGKTDPSVWFGARPDDPQLPLYCFTAEHPVGGIAFALVRPGGSELVGVSAQPCDIPKVTLLDKQSFAPGITSWTAFQEQQRTTLTQLATDFAAGHAAVDPKHPIDSCRYCELSALCRRYDSVTTSL